MDENVARNAFETAIGTYEQEFENFFLAKLLGMTFSYTEDACTVRMTVEDFMFNPQGKLHGGVAALLMDVSMGHLLKRVTGAGATLEMKIQYLKPLGSGVITATGTFLQRGKSTHFLRSELRNAANELAAFATATWKIIPPTRVSAM